MLKPTLGNSDAAVNSCCTPEEAWAWVADYVEGALAGDENYRSKLPSAIEHALRAELMCHIVSMEGL